MRATPQGESPKGGAASASLASPLNTPLVKIMTQFAAQ